MLGVASLMGLKDWPIGVKAPKAAKGPSIASHSWKISALTHPFSLHKTSVRVSKYAQIRVQLDLGLAHFCKSGSRAVVLRGSVSKSRITPLQVREARFACLFRFVTCFDSVSWWHDLIDDSNWLETCLNIVGPEGLSAARENSGEYWFSRPSERVSPRRD